MRRLTFHFEWVFGRSNACWGQLWHACIFLHIFGKHHYGDDQALTHFAIVIFFALSSINKIGYSLYRQRIHHSFLAQLKLVSICCANLLESFLRLFLILWGRHPRVAMADKLTRIAIVNNDRCRPKKCRQECKKSCPVVRMGNQDLWQIYSNFVRSYWYRQTMHRSNSSG